MRIASTVFFLLIGAAAFSGTIFVSVETAEEVTGEVLYELKEAILEGCFSHGHIVFDQGPVLARSPDDASVLAGLIATATKGGAQYIVRLSATSVRSQQADESIRIVVSGSYSILQVSSRLPLASGEVSKESTGSVAGGREGALGHAVGMEISDRIDSILSNSSGGV